MALTLSHEHHGDYAVIAVDGELDLATAPELADLASQLIGDGIANLVVDAGRLSFCDSTGLGVLVKVANDLQPGGRIAIADAQPIVLRVLQVTGLVGTILVAASVAEAAAALESAG